MNKVLVMFANSNDCPVVLKDGYFDNPTEFFRNRTLPPHEENFEIRAIDLENFNIETSYEEFLCNYNLLAYDTNPVETNGKDVNRWLDRVRTFEYFWKRAENAVPLLLTLQW